MKNLDQIHCQRCLSLNPLDQEHCQRCGTPLMLVVEPSAMRYEDAGYINGAHEEHLLERVSLLENRLLKMAERLEKTLDLFLRHTRSSHMSHLLLESLLGVLQATGKVDSGQLRAIWRTACERDGYIARTEDLRKELRDQILSVYEGNATEEFTSLIKSGFDGYEEGEPEQAVRTLERAAALAPGNAALNYFIGGHFFKEDKPRLACDYLARAYAIRPDDPRVCLLLGLAYGQGGDVARARDLLLEAGRREESLFAVPFALGRIAIAEGKWTLARSELKSALAIRACPEAHYTLGLVSFQMGHSQVALRHLRSALELDSSYADASYACGLIYAHLGQQERARKCFDHARATGSEPRYRAATRRPRAPQAALKTLLTGAAQYSHKHLLTGGDKRIAALIREQALSAAGYFES